MRKLEIILLVKISVDFINLQNFILFLMGLKNLKNLVEIEFNLVL